MKKLKLSLRGREAFYGLIFISPWLIGFIYFFVLQFAQTIIFSFNEIKIADVGGYTLVSRGLSNYKEAFLTDPDYVRTLVTSIFNIIIDVPLITFFSLLMAILLNKKFTGRSAIRAIFFLPVILASPAIVSAIDSALKTMLGGVDTIPTGLTDNPGVNSFFIIESLTEFGLPIAIVQYIIAAVGRIYEIVRRSGVQIIIFLAALQSLSPAFYEVAQIEGATSYETFWKITLPLVSPLILTNVIYTIIDTYNQSKVVEIAYNAAFSYNKFGLSSAMSVITTVAMCGILALIGYLISKKVFYQS